MILENQARYIYCWDLCVSLNADKVTRMFIKANKTTVRGKQYTNYLLVETEQTPKGPRHKVVCSLGNMRPAPAEHWRQLAQKIERALSGQLAIEPPDQQVEAIIEKIGAHQPSHQIDTAIESTTGSALSGQVDVDKVTVEHAREAGPVHVGHQMWLKLGLNGILQELGFDERECALTEILTLNRLVAPGSERATRDWVARTALPDILGAENCLISTNTLYEQLDKLHGLRSKIEDALAQKEQNLLNLDNSLLLYDLTSTYFEGACARNDQAQRGYSRDQRPDCKQVVAGLVLNRDRFPVAHEIFDGNTIDTTTVDQMLDVLDSRAGGARQGRTVIVDRGMSSKENLATIRERGYHYLVATRQQERDEYLADLESGDGWLTFQKLRQGKYITTVLNEVKIKRVAAESVRSVKEKKLEAVEQRFNRAAKAAVAAQEKGEDEELILQRSLKAVELNREFKNAKAELECEESLILCISQGRTLKDRAIREKQEKKFLADLQALENRSEAKTKSTLAKLHERIGRLKERYPRVARYYAITVDDSTNKVSHTELTEKKELAKQLDGSYIIRTDRNDLTDLEIWQTYMLLTRVESAFRDMKTPLMERPIYHHLENRVQTHIFICILAYHLLALVEKLFRDKAIATSWETIRDELTTHQVVTVVMPYSHSNKVLRIRKATTPEKAHDEIYGLLGITPEPMPPQKSWTTQESQAIFSH